MKKYIIFSAILLIVCHVLTEVYVLFWIIWPNTLTGVIYPFVDKKALPEGINPLWFIKNVTDELLICYVFFDYALTALKTSRKKFYVVLVFAFYHCIDFYNYLYNYKQSHWLYIAMLVIDVAAVIIILVPIKERGKLISMK